MTTSAGPLKPCPACKRQLAANAETCPKCGWNRANHERNELAAFKQKERPPTVPLTKREILVFTIIALVMVAFLGTGFVAPLIRKFVWCMCWLSAAVLPTVAYLKLKKNKGEVR